MVRQKTRWILIELEVDDEDAKERIMMGRSFAAGCDGVGDGGGGGGTGREKSPKKHRRSRNEKTTILTLMADTSPATPSSAVAAAPILNKDFPTKKDFTARLRRTIDRKYGPVVGEPISADLQVRYYDVNTRLVLVRVARQYADKVKQALSVLLTSKRLAAQGERGTGGPAFKTADLVARVVSVHGSARTAKIGTIKRLKEIYRIRLKQQQNGDEGPLQLVKSSSTAQQRDSCRQFHSALQSIQDVD